MTYRSAPDDGVAQLSRIMREAATEAPAPGESASETRPPRMHERLGPDGRRRGPRGGVIAGIVAVLVVALVGGYVGWALTAPLPAAAGDAVTPTAAAGAPARLDLPVDGAYALSVTGGEEFLGTGGLDVVSSDEQRSMASITKVVTALVILDAKPLASPDDPGPTITFSKADHDLYDAYYVQDATIAAMPTGSRMSLHDALEMMLVVSATNYADAVSTWAFGSRSAFLRATSAWLAANGFSRTTVVEPTGIDRRNVSTPSELLALGRLAMADPVVAGIVGRAALRVPGFEGASNTNALLGTEGIRGIKTGTLDTSNLLFSSLLDVGLEEPLEITGVVLGAQTRDSVTLEVRAWLESIRLGFHEVVANEKDLAIGTYSTPWGESSRILLAEEARLLTWSDTPIEATLGELRLETGAAGEQVGELTWTAGPRTVTVPVVLESTIHPPDEWWRLTHPSEIG
ncbi:D-alanyl-D-alanine carboxypeptidase [Protaetiibacter sp. SSC-01]|uniref:D-alanyl-D-alanine carboxypeptidase family protein n=1 Tax=Protaetiibacter sp. SSC-01 TaxID=2759943 RepID=UPI0016573B2C|nr:D-alanyl-D-alanine carboxypeptidase [Protaetiibacter sp. SSC-01]QNO37706.1 D-alanyl-D-alanine carboxypeptidase [Protaetiibacter sp. SSC-01]